MIISISDTCSPLILSSRLPYQMNRYETEALMFDPESRRGKSTAADVFFLFVLCFFVFSLPIWVYKCAWCLFFTESLCLMEKRKNKQGEKKHQAALLYPFHA